ncbi:MAG: hypothetical protein IJV71_12085 [Lachnospiraceae bacterium]|nr:hypothetical protein [Lachnospiraceae bacterium]
MDDIKIEPVDLSERVEEIRERAIFPILELIPVFEKEINKRVYGNVVVMFAGRGLRIRIQNDKFVFGYELSIDYLYGNIGIIIDDCMYKYQQEILKRYIKKTDVSEKNRRNTSDCKTSYKKNNKSNQERLGK